MPAVMERWSQLGQGLEDTAPEYPAMEEEGFRSPVKLSPLSCCMNVTEIFWLINYGKGYLAC